MLSASSNTPYLERALSTADAAALCGVSPRTLIVYRSVGGGPAYVKLGRRVAYLPEVRG